MTIKTNPALYELFEKAIRTRLATATTVAAVLEDTRADGSTFTYTQELPSDDFGRIPWGKVDAIHEAHWYPGGRPEPGFYSRMSLLLPKFMHVRVFLDTWNNGIGVYSTLRDEPVTIGVKGTVSRSSSRETVVCSSEDEAIVKITEIIDEIFDEYKAEMRYRAEDDLYDDGDSRYDPLDERNYPLWER